MGWVCSTSEFQVWSPYLWWPSFRFTKPQTSWSLTGLSWCDWRVVPMGWDPRGASPYLLPIRNDRCPADANEDVQVKYSSGSLFTTAAIKDQPKPVTRTPIQECYIAPYLLIAQWLCHHMQSIILKGDYFITPLYLSCNHMQWWEGTRPWLARS